MQMTGAAMELERDPSGLQQDNDWPKSWNFSCLIFRLRMLGLALCLLAIAPAFHALSIPLWVGVAAIAHTIVWPYMTYWHLQANGGSFKSRNKHLCIDHLLGGLWTVAAGFNMLPCLLMYAVMTLGSVVCGGWKLMLYGLLAHIAGMALGVLLLQVHWAPESSLWDIAACLPLLLAYPAFVGMAIRRAWRELSAQRTALMELSLRDALSGLYNRRYWDRRVAEEYARFRRGGNEACLVLIDLDNFKNVNDQYGHPVGDDVIRRFGRMLAKDLRNIDVACRYGGEEFALLLPNTSPQTANEAMRRLQNRLHEQPLIPQTLVTASFGIAGLSSEMKTAADWISQADQMLYQAKHRGRNRIVSTGMSAVLRRA
ncbi:diguanylate cyclase [Comamonas humi]